MDSLPYGNCKRADEHYSATNHAAFVVTVAVLLWFLPLAKFPEAWGQADTPTPTPISCCQCPNPACGPPGGSGNCDPQCTQIMEAVCLGDSGSCATVTQTRTVTETPTETATRTRTPTQTPTATLGGFFVGNLRCYRAKDGEKSTTPLPELSIVDHFEDKDTRLIRAALLCSPADVNGEGMQFPDDYVVCYKSRDLPGQPRFSRRTVKMRNRFGDDVDVAMLAPGYLCVPARRIVPTRTPTPPESTPTQVPPTPTP